MTDSRLARIEALRRRLGAGGNQNRINFTSTQIEGIIERFGLPAGLARSRAFLHVRDFNSCRRSIR